MSSYSVERVGSLGEPVVVIDDFHPDPDGLRRAALGADFQTRAKFYPGLQAPADPSHLKPVMPVVGEVLGSVFGGAGGQLVQCAHSLVTLPDDALAPIQRLPHIDTPDPGRIALLHYLSDDSLGGTAFYRHKATGLDALSPETFADYRTALEAEGMPKPGYMRGSDARFAMIHHVAARSNRAVLYRSRLLHSGMIPEGAILSDDPAKGRLTLNSFFQIRLAPGGAS